ncbi:hypothetical protein SEA_REINDEER_65 [Mycobacterium phage Reindeer]|uniref:Uncharacterized protein n=1 Tax=Mycobacterium phage Reindeer TaxID=2762283 RepID=A0A7G8LI03_9CAUD|nr:hypothetical protein J4U05_gp065 [Mycobacterium phage Reindeer]QNJ56875.1 hypothetical protein SEA_REINDEER_65 [Mycobacterium phage Reindeer]
MATAILKIRGPYGPDGTQGEDGVERYNDEVATPYGLLGDLRVHDEDGKRYITKADDVVLIRRGFPDEWTPGSLQGAAMSTNVLGFTMFRLEVENGFVTYHVLDDDLRWEDDFDGVESSLANYQLGIRAEHQWTPVFDPPGKYKHEVITRDLKLVDPK